MAYTQEIIARILQTRIVCRTLDNARQSNYEAVILKEFLGKHRPTYKRNIRMECLEATLSCVLFMTIEMVRYFGPIWTAPLAIAWMAFGVTYLYYKFGSELDIEENQYDAIYRADISQNYPVIFWFTSSVFIDCELFAFGLFWAIIIVYPLQLLGAFCLPSSSWRTPDQMWLICIALLEKLDHLEKGEKLAAIKYLSENGYRLRKARARST